MGGALTEWGRHRHMQRDDDMEGEGGEEDGGGGDDGYDAYSVQQHFEYYQRLLEERDSQGRRGQGRGRGQAADEGSAGQRNMQQLPFGAQLHFCRWKDSLAAGLFFNPPLITSRRVAMR